MNDIRYPYDAFISYSCAADRILAPAMHKALHRLAKPWYKLRALRIFRDETNLDVKGFLWPFIEKALAKSRYFILLTSPEASQSDWVKDEVQWWLNNRSIEELFVVLTEGQVVWSKVVRDFDWNLSDAIPTLLQGNFLTNRGMSISDGRRKRPIFR